MRSNFPGYRSLACLVISLAFTHFADAQTGNSPSQSPQTPPAQGQNQNPAQPLNVDPAQLDKFVEAYKDVQAIQERAQLEMQQAVTDNGLSLQDYQQIFNEAWQNPGLRSRIEKKLNTGESPS